MLCRRIIGGKRISAQAAYNIWMMWQLKKAAPPNKFFLLIIRDKDKLIDSLVI